MGKAAPLRAITGTRPGPAHVIDDIADLPRVELPTIINTLECGHETEPIISGGCRVGKMPKRRRCKKCQQEITGTEGDKVNG